MYRYCKVGQSVNLVQLGHRVKMRVNVTGRVLEKSSNFIKL